MNIDSITDNAEAPRTKDLQEKFGNLSPSQFVDYCDSHPECESAHEFLTRIASREYITNVLRVAEKRKPIQDYSKIKTI